jgi:MFS family permease
MARSSRGHRLLVLAICCMSLLLVGLDTTIVNLALPSIHRELKASVSGLQWTIDASTLVLASLLMLACSTADRLGRKRVFRVGLVVFAFGSLLCGLAPSLGFLIAARVIQAIGAWGAVFGLSLALGPVVGGALVDASWRAVFFVNVPVGLLAILLTALYVPESRAERPRRIDPIGQVLVIVGLGALTYAIIEGPTSGWTSPRSLAVFALAVVCLVALIPYELHREEPLLEMRFVRSAPFSGANAIAVLTFAGLGGSLFMNTLYLQTARGFRRSTPGSTRSRWPR